MLEKDDHKKEVYDYMLKNFYTKALIPSTIKLTDTLKEFPYLDEELHMFMNSGLSEIFLNDQGSIVGAHLLSVWKADKDYPVFDVPIKDWFNAADRLASEHGKSDSHRIVIWRNYQMWFMYHVGQCLAREQNKPWLIYPSISFVDKEYRGPEVSRNFLHSNWQFHDSPTTVNYTLGTFPHFAHHAEIIYEGKLKILDSAKYADLSLMMSDGRNLFESLKDKEGVTLIEH